MGGIKFRRQQPVGYFVVDFYNSVYRLVVEVDGSIHDSQVEADRARQDVLELVGLNVLRIKAETVEKNLPVALNEICAKIEEIKIKTNKSPSQLVGKGLGERLDFDND